MFKYINNPEIDIIKKSKQKYIIILALAQTKLRRSQANISINQLVIIII